MGGTVLDPDCSKGVVKSRKSIEGIAIMNDSLWLIGGAG